MVVPKLLRNARWRDLVGYPNSRLCILRFGMCSQIVAVRFGVKSEQSKKKLQIYCLAYWLWRVLQFIYTTLEFIESTLT